MKGNKPDLLKRLEDAIAGGGGEQASAIEASTEPAANGEQVPINRRTK